MTGQVGKKNTPIYIFLFLLFVNLTENSNTSVRLYWKTVRHQHGNKKISQKLLSVGLLLKGYTTPTVIILETHLLISLPPKAVCIDNIVFRVRSKKYVIPVEMNNFNYLTLFLLKVSQENQMYFPAAKYLPKAGSLANTMKSLILSFNMHCSKHNGSHLQKWPPSSCRIACFQRCTLL